MLLVTLLLNLARPNSCKGKVSEGVSPVTHSLKCHSYCHSDGSGCLKSSLRMEGGTKGKCKNQHKERVEQGGAVALLLKLTWMARETPNRLEETQASRLTSVQLLFSGFTRYSQRSSTTCRRHSPAVGAAASPPSPSIPTRQQHLPSDERG